MARGDDNGQRRVESYTWPLTTIAMMIAVQALVPEHDRVGPPLFVPIIEAIVFLMGLAIAAKPGPVPQSAQPFVLALFAVLVVANAGNAVHLVAAALDVSGTKGVSYTAGRLLVGGALAIGTNIVTFGLVYWQVDGGGPGGRANGPARYPDFQFPQTGTPSWRPRAGGRSSSTSSMSPTPTSSRSARPTRCR